MENILQQLEKRRQDARLGGGEKRLKHRSKGKSRQGTLRSSARQEFL